MISFNLTALTQPTLSIQRKSKTRDIFPRKTSHNFTQFSFISSTFILLSCFNLRIVSTNTALHHFKKKAMAATNTQFTIDDDQEMETEPIYLSSDESENESPPSSPLPKLPNNTPDKNSAITQLIAAQHEQMPLSGISDPQCPITPPTSLISDDEDNETLPSTDGVRAQFSTYTRDRRPIPDTPQSPTPENCCQSVNFHPTNIPLHNPPNIVAVSDELRNLTLHPHPHRNETITSCLVCGKSYDQVIEETAADYLNHTAQPGETVRERQIKRRNAFIDGVQSGVFNFIPPGVSQAAACDGMIYSVNYNGQNSVTQGYALPLFED